MTPAYTATTAPPDDPVPAALADPTTTVIDLVIHRNDLAGALREPADGISESRGQGWGRTRDQHR